MSINTGIIGSGIAGLTAGWALSRAGVDVTVLESRSGIGIDAHAVVIEGPGHSPTRADVPSRMFNQRLWPRLFDLYSQLDIKSEPVDASQSFSTLGQKPWWMTRQAWRPGSGLGMLTRRTGRRVFRDIRRLMRGGRIDLDRGLAKSVTLAQYLSENRYSDEFVRDFLYPNLSSTVCTCSYGALDEYPAYVALQALRDLTDPGPLLRARQGTADVARRLAAGIKHILTDTPVVAVIDRGNTVQVDCQSGRSLEFDCVVIATQANQALRLLVDPTADEQAVLSSQIYQPVQVVVHSDHSLMPPDPRDWRTFNMISNREKTAACCSVWLNRFQQEWPDSVTPRFQTIWAGQPDDFQISRQSIANRFDLQRPTVTQLSLESLRALDKIHRNPRRIWFCGSYAGAGTPLLESGVTSALTVARRIAGSSQRPISAAAGEPGNIWPEDVTRA